MRKDEIRNKTATTVAKKIKNIRKSEMKKNLEAK